MKEENKWVIRIKTAIVMIVMMLAAYGVGTLIHDPYAGSDSVAPEWDNR